MKIKSFIKEAGELIKQAKYLVCLTGSGISAESGIPTFRGKDGLWKKYKAEELATYEAFINNPELVWDWYRWRMNIIKKAHPNKGHLTLAKWEEKGLLKTIITQNVDGLHQRAGNSSIIELHGNIWRGRCIECGYKIYFKDVPKEKLPRCPRCDNLLRPDVVWFGEPLDTLSLNKAYQEALKADVFLVVGTSGLVYPAAHIPMYAKENGAKIIEINPGKTILTEMVDVKISMKAADAFSWLDNFIT